MHYINALNDYANNQTHMAWLETHLTNFKPVDLEKPYYKWSFHLDEPIDYTQSQFSGTLYAIINSSTASSAENAVGYAKSVRNCILIGENTFGCGVFGELQSYVLKNSLIWLGVPCKVFLSESKEGEGYTPDFWVDNDDIQGEVIKWLNDPYYFPTLRNK